MNWGQKKKWRPQCYEIKYFSETFIFCRNTNAYNILRFNPIQIAEWLHRLLGTEHFASQTRLSHELGVDRTRVQQFLHLFKIPADLRVQLKRVPWLTEGELRRIVRMEPIAQR